MPSHLQKLYKRIKHYQRQLARKRKVNGKQATQSNNYAKTRAKLQRDYRRVTNVQHDLMQKFTTQLVNDYDQIAIENLACSTFYIAEKRKEIFFNAIKKFYSHLH